MHQLHPKKKRPLPFCCTLRFDHTSALFTTPPSSFPLSQIPIPPKSQMASPHHHPHLHPHHHCSSHHYYSSCCSSSSSCCCCCCCCNSSSTQPPPPPSAPSTTTTTSTDPLLHALANHLLLLQSPKPSPPPPPPLYSYPHLKPYPSPQTQHPQPHDHHQQQLLHSLLRRISALESSLPHLSPPPHPSSLTHAHSKRSPSPKKHLSSPPPPLPQPPTLHDLAARTIQIHFRLFLVRRSQTLRHLKHLASIKSHVASLRSSLSDKTHLHPAALSESAMALLLELDAIQGGDPMIREGKRSISRELTRILDFVDKVLVKEKELMEITENAYEVIPPTRTGKKVSFFEKGRRSPVCRASHGPFPEKSRLLRMIRRDSKENGIDGSHRLLDSDDENDEEEEEEKSSESNSESPKTKMGLSAPLPVQMEPRRLSVSR